MHLSLPFSLQLPQPLRARVEAFEQRLGRVSTQLNEYGYDRFGMEPGWIRRFSLLGVLLYDYYFRVETRGIERVPEGPLLLVANHAGNTVPMDGGLLYLAMLLEAEPPRLLRAMAEFFLPNIPYWSELIRRMGAVIGTPENCRQLLQVGECVLVFPEGSRGFIKPYAEAYQLQEFGRGFARLALETGVPVLPVGIVGSEEQSPGLLDSKSIANLIGTPAFPITVTFPFLGPLGFLPLPVKYRIHFGEALRLEGDPEQPDQELQAQVDRVRDAIALLIEEGLAERRGWFS